MKIGWVKHFKDGQSETGFRDQIRAKKASWRHGRLDGLIAVDLFYGSIQVTLNAGEGDWWQSDTLVSYCYAGTTKYLTCRVQKCITKDDIGKYIVQIPRHNNVLYRLDTKTAGTPQFLLGREHVGKWLTVSLNAQEGSVSVGLLNNKK